MFIDYIAWLFVFILLGAFIYMVISIPVRIARARGICGRRQDTIRTLSWLGVFFGVTWVAALILSLIRCGDGNSGCGGCNSRLDELEKLAKLYRSHVITKAEYEKMKAKLLRD